MRASSEAMAAALSPLLRAFAVADGPVTTTYSMFEIDDPTYRFVLYAGPRRIAMVPVFRRLVAGLLWHLNGEVADAAAEDLVLLHASVAACDGRAVAIPGPSGAGKSTLVAALVQDGFEYLSDEIAAVSPALEAMPYPKPISLEPGSWPLLPELEPPLPPGPVDDHEPWQVVPTAVATGGRLAAVVFLERRPGAEAELSRVTAADALPALTASSFHRGPAAVAALSRLRAVVDAVPCFRLTYEDLGAAVAHIRKSLTIME